MGKLYFHRALMEPVICHLSTRSRFAYGTSPNQAPIDKRRIKTIFNHFRDKPAPYCSEPGIIDVASYDDVVKAIDDGRMERIVKEYELYEKEYKD
jgi:hypothetical protein